MKLKKQKAKRLTIPKALVAKVNPLSLNARLSKTASGLFVRFTRDSNLQLTKSGSVEIRPSWLPKGKKLRVEVVGKSILVS
jgi:hypothetical protein